MALCESISIIASSLEEQLSELQTNHRDMLKVMKAMPSYLEQSNLAEWEAEYRAAIGDEDDESSENFKAIDLVYELAAVNLFGEFQKRETRRLYKFMVTELKKMQLLAPQNLDVSEW